MASKEQFLNNIAKRLGRERRHGVKSPAYDNNPWDHLYQDYSQEDYIKLFMENLSALTAKAVRVKNSDQLLSALKEIITAEQAKTAIMWKDQRLNSLALNQTLISEGLKTKEWDPAIGKNELIDYAEQADLGFTIADMGLAETGSVLLYNKGELGRSVSLLPTVFVSFVRTTDIQPRITSALKQIHEKHQKEGLPSLINFITGPSRSADIEMSLSIGVHGPGKVYIILLDY